VDLVAGAVEEARVDEHEALAGAADALLQIDGGAPLLVHDAELERVALHAQGVLDAGEQVHGEADLVGPVHLRLDDVHAAGAGVAQGARTLAGRAGRSAP
jgi:hypothetical protein